MDLHEYQAKEIFRDHGIPVPPGKVVTSAKSGLTLYTFRNDDTDVSNCYGDCATAWPPFLASASAQPEGGLDIIERNDGSLQYALNGKPLWRYQAAKGGINVSPILHGGDKLIYVNDKVNVHSSTKGGMVALNSRV